MSVEIDVPDLIDLDTMSVWLDRISSGDVITGKCGSCGSVIQPEVALRIKWPSKQVDLLVLPELERISVYRGKCKVENPTEIVIGYPELIERIRILRDGLDPQACEIMKLYIYAQAETQVPEAQLVVLYHALHDGHLEFRILGMKAGQTGILRLPLSSYERAQKQKKNLDKRLKELLSGSYRSVRTIGFMEDYQD